MASSNPKDFDHLEPPPSISDPAHEDARVAGVLSKDYPLMLYKNGENTVVKDETEKAIKLKDGWSLDIEAPADPVPVAKGKK